MSAQDYSPSGSFPYFRASGGFGPLQLQNRGDVLSEAGTFQANAEIADVSNTTPIVVTTAAPHYFATGDTVIGIGSDDAPVNSPHVITVLSGTTFSLNGSTADGGGSAAGIVTALQRGTLGKLIDACDILGQALGMAANHQYGDPIAIPVAVTINNTLEVAGNVTLDTTLHVTGNATVSGSHGVALDGTQPAKSADPGANNLSVATNQCKAWGNIAVGSGVTLNDGYNTSGVSTSGNNVVVAFARSMANADYAVTFGVEMLDTEVTSSGMVPQPFVNLTGAVKTAAGFSFKLWNANSGSVINPASSSSLVVNYTVFARQ